MTFSEFIDNISLSGLELMSISSFETLNLAGGNVNDNYVKEGLIFTESQLINVINGLITDKNINTATTFTADNIFISSTGMVGNNRTVTIYDTDVNGFGLTLTYLKVAADYRIEQEDDKPYVLFYKASDFDAIYSPRLYKRSSNLELISDRRESYVLEYNKKLILNDTIILTTGNTRTTFDQIADKVSKAFFFNNNSSSSSDTNTTTTIAGAIRRAPNPNNNDVIEWYVIDDDSHAPTGIQSFTPVGDYELRVNFDKAYSEAISMIISPDETLSEENFHVGVSLGTSLAIVKAYYKPFSKFLITKTAGNWVASHFTGLDLNVSVSSSTTNAINITHDSIKSTPVFTMTDDYIVSETSSGLSYTQKKISLFDNGIVDLTTLPNGQRFLVTFTSEDSVPYPLNQINNAFGNLWIIGFMKE